ncbi:MAG: BlaI/MecI/CopY family transcriptional regulator [Defluviitaleaceae bacterium]|nr:BlaI/MecI/CopY family transcriptional regulator [Defluviitaleaceae bacterium]
MKSQHKISDSELEVMRILWRDQSPKKASELCEELEQTKRWSRSTTNTLITRLRDKGLIESPQRYGVARYIPLISEDEYILAEEKALLARFGSAKKLALAMVRNKHLTNTDIEELQQYFNTEGGDING